MLEQTVLLSDKLTPLHAPCRAPHGASLQTLLQGLPVAGAEHNSAELSSKQIFWVRCTASLTNCDT